jgi:hypothetical protein
MQVFELAGTQWRIEARTLAWIGRAAELGMAPSHRLERLSSRADGAAGGVDLIQSAYALAEDRGADLWTQVQQGPIWNRALEAVLAASPWQPMANGARFEVRIGPAGLEATPLNAAASASLAAAR